MIFFLVYNQTSSIRLITRWKMIGKINNLSEKLENKLRDVVRHCLTFWLFSMEKNYLSGEEESFHKK